MNLFENARIHMIESQLRPNKVVDDRVLRAFASIRRELFVPEHLRQVAYVDEDLPLGGGRYLMEPRVAARLLQAAEVEPTDAAFVVGAGTGYEAAVIAVLTRYVVALDGGGELVVSRQNTEVPTPGSGGRGGPVRIAWRPEQAFTIPAGEGP